MNMIDQTSLQAQLREATRYCSAAEKESGAITGLCKIMRIEKYLRAKILRKAENKIYDDRCYRCGYCSGRRTIA